MSAAHAVHAQDAGAMSTASSPSSSVSEVIVTGTRQTGVKAADSAAPIEVVGTAALTQRTGNPDLANALATAVPSFNVQQYGADTAPTTPWCW
jgi:iron complex outermembrane receptor protein